MKVRYESNVLRRDDIAVLLQRGDGRQREKTILKTAGCLYDMLLHLERVALSLSLVAGIFTDGKENRLFWLMNSTPRERDFLSPLK